jgi:prepilin-type N-terminal cleavage/methylation domain-containing protein
LNNGFTLAEVLITLLIIGVISSIVIPSIVQDSHNAEFKTTWRKTYADFSLATKRIASENGGTLKGLFTNSDTFKNTFISYFNYAKSCPASQELSPGCWHCDNTKTCKYLNGSIISNSWGGDSTLYLSNGVSMVFFTSSGSCDPYCGSIYTDINGPKPPNVAGKDLFLIHVYENKAVAYGTGATITCPSGRGWDCSALYLVQ